METKAIIDVSLHAFMRAFQEYVQVGWEIDETHPPQMWGIAYEANLVRSDKTLAAIVARAGSTEPKMTRVEALTVARAARAEKRAAVLQGTDDGTA